QVVLDFAEVLSQGDAQLGGVAEFDEAELVFRIGHTEKLSGGLPGAGQLALHAAAGIEDQAHGDGRVVHSELHDRLLHTVFEELEVFALQAGNGPVVFVVDANGNQHQLRIHAQAGFGKLIGLRGGRRPVNDGSLSAKHN